MYNAIYKTKMIREAFYCMALILTMIVFYCIMFYHIMESNYMKQYDKPKSNPGIQKRH